jgi:hypothetical protein
MRTSEVSSCEFNEWRKPSFSACEKVKHCTELFLSVSTGPKRQDCICKDKPGQHAMWAFSPPALDWSTNEPHSRVLGFLSCCTTLYHQSNLRSQAQLTLIFWSVVIHDLGQITGPSLIKLKQMAIYLSPHYIPQCQQNSNLAAKCSIQHVKPKYSTNGHESVRNSKGRRHCIL